MHWTKHHLVCLTSILYTNGKFEAEKISLEEFFQRYSTFGFSVMDEVYGYNQTKYWGYLTSNREFYECIIEFYHLGDMIFVED